MLRCQGEENVGSAAYVACALPSMIARWREAFASPNLWWGVVQLAGWRYSQPDPAASFAPEVPNRHTHSAAAW